MPESCSAGPCGSGNGQLTCDWGASHSNTYDGSSVDGSVFVSTASKHRNESGRWHLIYGGRWIRLNSFAF
jgi:hypothetical protein